MAVLRPTSYMSDAEFDEHASGSDDSASKISVMRTLRSARRPGFTYKEDDDEFEPASPEARRRSIRIKSKRSTSGAASKKTTVDNDSDISDEIVVANKASKGADRPSPACDNRPATTSTRRPLFTSSDDFGPFRREAHRKAEKANAKAMKHVSFNVEDEDTDFTSDSDAEYRRMFEEADPEDQKAIIRLLAIGELAAENAKRVTEKFQAVVNAEYRKLREAFEAERMKSQRSEDELVAEETRIQEHAAEIGRLKAENAKLRRGIKEHQDESSD